jgi:tetratricopeptide (TPR) repeat protein
MTDLENTTPALLQQALALHRAGRVQESETIFKAILQREPENFDALYWLALAAIRAQRQAEALQWLDRALTVKPDSAAALNARGSALRALKRPEEALASYDRALACDANDSNVHNNRGNVLKDLGRHAEALQSYEKALALQGDFPEAHFNRGLAFEAMGRQDEALAAFDRAIALRSTYAEAFNSRGIVFQNQKRITEALASFEAALAVRPEYPDALSNRGAALHALERYDESLASYDRAVTVRPDHAEAWYNRGNTLRSMGLLNSAVTSYTRAITLRPEYPEAYVNRGLVEQDLGQVEGAIQSYERAIALKPSHVEAHWNLSLALLVAGELPRGWDKYEWRWQRPSVNLPPDSHLRPRWTGTESLAGKTLLLRNEQGFGDTLQFCRYASLCQAQGARVILEVQRDLVPLMRGLAGPELVIGRGDPLPPHDLQCPLLSLPFAFRTGLDNLPAPGRYLAAAEDKTRAWLERLSGVPAPRVGVVVSGSPTHGRDRERSIALHDLLTELDLSVNWVSLQKECRKGDMAAIRSRRDVAWFGDELRDFSDTAALVEAMDLIITVDTSVAHLAGALGKPVWVMLPFSPDWRWMWHGTTTPWYPSMTLYRQQAGGDWQGVFARIRENLVAWLAARG